MSFVGIVPMKGHSERVPGKNLRDIAGRPLFSWITEALEGADGIDEVMVDTDSDEIESAVAEAFPGVTIHRRPDHLHGDFVPMHDIVAHIAAETSHEHILQTHATNPLLTSATIDRAVDTFLRQTGHDSLMSVTAWRSRFFFEDGRPVNHDPAELIRTQDLPPLLEENSNIYISAAPLIVQTGLRIGANPLLFEIEASESVDIDDEFDFRIAEFLLENRNE